MFDAIEGLDELYLTTGLVPNQCSSHRGIILLTVNHTAKDLQEPT